MSKNKIGKSLPVVRSDQEKEILDLINKSRDLSSTVLECGSAFAIINAKNFVESRTGYNINKIAPQFIGNILDDNLLIDNISREINRADGTYGCTVASNGS